MTVAVDRLCYLRDLNRQACLIRLGRCKINYARLSTLLRRLDINRRRIITRRLAAITGPLNRLRPIIPIILIRAILCKIGEVLQSRLLRMTSLLLYHRALTVKIFLLTIIRLEMIVMMLSILLCYGLQDDAIRNGLRILT